MALSLFYVFCTWIVFLVMIHSSLAKPLCHRDESSALMEFKRNFRINRETYYCVYPKVESWSSYGLGDCCSWDGVECDKATGHVTGLDLSNSCLFGTITSNTSLFHLLHLESINLAWNDFNSSSIPYGFGNLSRQCGLYGEFSINIFQLPNLEVLDISGNGNLSGEIPVSIGNLVFLNKLLIWLCHFSGSLPTSLSNLSQLAYLDISYNKFHGQIPASFANLTQLSYVDLSANNFTGDIWHWLVNLSKLTHLRLIAKLIILVSFHLADVQLSGPIPSLFDNLTRLVVLDLLDNNLEGEIPNSLWELKDLEFLGLDWNNLSSTADLHKLKNLESLYLDSNNISFISKTETNGILPKLSILHLSSCNLHEFPNFIGNLSRLKEVDLSNNKIGGSIPTWVWNGSGDTLEWVDLSHNFLTGFGNNQINQPLPKLAYLDISSNQLKTKLPSPPPLAVYYNISNNFLFGEIQSICRARSLLILDLSNYSLNGTIPSCLGNIESLSILDLGKNKFKGTIPHAYPKDSALKIIDLTENRLQGPVPRSLVNCKMLEYLNLGFNQILDGFPLWLSELTKLKAIILKSNKFHGPIETYRSQFNFSNMHIMDLSYNSFSGELPSKLLQSFRAMKVIVSQDRLEYMHALEVIYLPQMGYEKVVNYGMKLMSKGTEREYSKVPNALMQVDLSHNKFEGCIPNLIGDLKSLHSLNLSNNILTGSIPPSLANLTELESLDLSRNNLSGEIPQQLAQLTFLSSFNVFHNQLSGPIPRGTQFDTFAIDSFTMNKGLRGSPLPKKCTTLGDILPLSLSSQQEIGEESLLNLVWKFVLIGAGVGFLIGIVLGNLIIDEKSRWFLHSSKRIAKGWKRPGRR
ncbi:hypothetical protein BT93_E1098 [Corymbia citriodora subsp. variegata]|nr:hypothetical protein BT93_E1098 [Corymbia citriodora subsp. variegata]